MTGRLGSPRLVWVTVAAVASIAATSLTTNAAALPAASADATLVTVAVDVGATLEYYQMPRSQVAGFVANVGGDVVAAAVPQPVSIASAWPTTDPLSPLQWAISAAGFADLDARASGAGITVAVIDTGVRGDHEDLSGSIVDGGDFIAPVSQSMTDPNGHGTHVAGIIAAHAYNGVGIAGGAPAATIRTYRVLDAIGGGFTNDIAKAITAAVDDGAKVINLSVGGGNDPVLAAAVADATARGSLVVAASGNNALTTNEAVWPAADPNALAVGATRPTGERAGYSTTGPQLDLAAPGEQIASTWSSSTSSYQYSSGTSMATPYVSAAAAAIWSAHPTATNAQVRAALESSATDLGVPGPDTSFGNGLINTVAALAQLDVLVANPSPTPVVPPTTLPPAPVTGKFVAVAPVRVFDTRPDGTGVRDVVRSKVGGGHVLEVKMTDVPGAVPGSGVDAVSINVTATNTEGSGFVTVFPCGERRLVSSLNYAAGDTVANAVITQVSPSGSVCFFSSASADILVDVNGWFPPNSGYTAVAPVRVFDTRPDGAGVRDVVRTKVGGGHTLEVRLTDIPGAVPVAGVDAVSINVTATNTNGSGFVTVYPCSERRDVSSLNYPAGGTVANAVIAPVSAQGTVCFFSLTRADLIVDVNGWFAHSGSSYTPVDPQRLFDTRPGTDGMRVVPKAPVGAGYVLEVKASDLPGFVPATGVAAVSLNVTATEGSASGYVTVFPCGERRAVSSLNFAAGGTVANAVIAPLSPQGTVCFYSPAPVQLIADVNGWFAALN
jgi:subtilisin family serine protease